MSNIQVFKNKTFGEVRVAGTSEEPLFCLADVCKILDLTPSKVVQRLNDDVLSKHPIVDSLGREQLANFVTEDGLYDTILDSRKPEARQFRKWVTSEVLPSIRKHGAYMTGQTLEKALTSPDFLIQLATTLKEEQQKRLEAEQKAEAANRQIQADAPKVLFAEAIVGSKTSCLIGELAKVITQNGYEVGQNRLFKWLRSKHYLGAVGERYNIPNQQYVEQGLFEVKKGVRSGNEGVLHTTITTKVTPKGQMYFINGFLTGKFSL